MTKNMKKMFIQLCLLNVIFFPALSYIYIKHHIHHIRCTHLFLLVKVCANNTVFFFPLGSFVYFVCASGFNKLSGISVAFLPGLIQVCW